MRNLPQNCCLIGLRCGITYIIMSNEPKTVRIKYVCGEKVS